MCGILGSINIPGTPDYLDLIKHRGPDGCGQQEFTVNHHTVNLLHRRLSIVDLSEAGAQPMNALDRSSCLIFNGEIYNHETLKERLTGTTFRGHSDTETILNYFGQFGIQEKLRDLNGIFGLAWLDLNGGQLHLARDRFGVKPLYYYFEENKLMFCSELRPLRAFFNPQVEPGRLLAGIKMRYAASPATIFRKIQKVEPGQLITFDLKQEITMTRRYFVEKPEKIGTRKSDYRQLVREYGDLFVKGVQRQLMADVEIGILLSGGVDSALVAAVAKENSATPPKAFTIGFEGNHAEDETGAAAETAAILGLEHYVKKIGFPDFLTSIKKITGIVEEPIGTTSIIPMYYLSQMASAKVKVVLSGQGADEPLGGYKKYKGLPYLQSGRHFRSLFSAIGKLDFLWRNRESVRRLIAAIGCQENTSAFVEFNAIFSTAEILSLVTPENRKRYASELRNSERMFKQVLETRTPGKARLTDLFLYYDLRTSLSDDLLMYTDKITMHFGLECRVPILDNDLIAFIESLDHRYKFNLKTGKIIHKDFAREYLPSAIVERKKLGFKSPTKNWIKENKKDIAAILNDSPDFNAYFNAKAVQELLDSHAKGINREKHLFILLSLIYLLDNNKSSNPRPVSHDHLV
ncbi:MAG TPA: asparagine synthase (glutamine-hydrolyzing) [Puia sp.]|nr:asparagine synthase (glutamine-hydrolyzing) [Puia sp.]